MWIESCNNAHNVVAELIEMGDYYLEKDLIKRSGQQLGLFINEGNALRIYDVAVKHELEVFVVILFL